MHKKFLKIARVYDRFHSEMLAKGRLMVKDTDIGYWGISPLAELFELFQKTRLDKHKRFIDLGSGDGRAVHVAELFTNADGVEFDEELHGFSLDLSKKLSSRAKFFNKDYLEHDLSLYDYIFIHPDQHISKKLEPKLIKEMSPKAKLVVFGPHYLPASMQKQEQIDVHGTFVHVFRR